MSESVKKYSIWKHSFYTTSASMNECYIYTRKCKVFKSLLVISGRSLTQRCSSRHHQCHGIHMRYRDPLCNNDIFLIYKEETSFFTMVSASPIIKYKVSASPITKQGISASPNFKDSVANIRTSKYPLWSMSYGSNTQRCYLGCHLVGRLNCPILVIRQIIEATTQCAENILKSYSSITTRYQKLC
jgi:hypothetical protein